ncbi:hypothetical protein Hanom_Chr17g01569991 [Helianthus anomalus]
MFSLYCFANKLQAHECDNILLVSKRVTFCGSRRISNPEGFFNKFTCFLASYFHSHAFAFLNLVVTM